MRGPVGGDREPGAGGSSGSGSGAAVAVVRLIEKLFFNNLLEEFVGGKSTPCDAARTPCHDTLDGREGVLYRCRQRLPVTKGLR